MSQTAQSKRPRGRPRLDRRHEEVLTCAAAMFSSRGYAATTLEDIGAELGLTRPGLYYYAKSKDDLLNQCYAWSFKKLTDRVNAELGDGTGRERLARFFQIYSEAVCDDASRCFLASENHFLTPESQKEAAKRVSEVNRIVGGLIDQGIADGSLAQCDRKYALIVLFGAFNSLPKLYKHKGPPPDEMGQNLFNFIINGLLPKP
nr:TetR/AcrR family transcriptional regulator [uncultured Hyphomonas sp.]